MFAQQLVNGVLLGATYALFALGFTLMFGVLRVINLTYGFYFSAGALIALWLTRTFSWPIAASLPAAAAASGMIAVVLDWLLDTVVVRPGLSEIVAAHDPLIISAGFHELIEPVLAREGVAITEHLDVRGGRRDALIDDTFAKQCVDEGTLSSVELADDDQQK